MTVRGTLRVPGDKSLSHRALIFGALSAGRSRIRDVLLGADVQSTAGVLRALGADVPPLSDDIMFTGVGVRGLTAPVSALDCGNSGTTTRLIAGVVAGHPITATFTGDASLSRRPMRRVAAPLSAMGATVVFASADGLPMTVSGGTLHATAWRTETASAQVKSAILLAALCGGVDVTVDEPSPSRDHTERMLHALGADIDVASTRVTLRPATALRPLDIRIPADPSSAAFFAALAALTGGEIELADVCLNPTRTGFFRVLERMGAPVRYDDLRDEGGEPVGTVRVGGGALRGVDIGGAEIPTMIDELPLLACVAAMADGETTVRDAGELRGKESDRIAAVVANLRAIGVDAEERPDGFRVGGAPRGRRPQAATVVTHGDHRVAMAFGVLGAATGCAIEVDDPACVAVSYPGFWQDLARMQR